MMSNSRLDQVSELGFSVWIGMPLRDMNDSGELERQLEEDAVVGVATNPSIFQKALASGDAYDEEMREVMDGEDDDKEVFFKLAVSDVQRACDILRPVWDDGNGRDGYVSLEVEPDIASDTDTTRSEAKRLSEMVDRPNVFIKIPATEPGLQAIEDSIAAGIPINITLIFSLERYKRVAEAYIKGLERLVDDGGDPSKVAAVASVFLSRVDTEADKRLDSIGGHDDLKGKLAIANARLAYQAYKEIFSGERWQKLADKGASAQRCLWASTSTKNDDYRDVIYVEELIGADTVNTMPVETVKAFQDHGEVAETIEKDVDEAKALLDKLAEAGVDYVAVVKVLEEEGVQKFSDSFKELLDGVAEKREALVAG